jgi:hypothetical protein
MNIYSNPHHYKNRNLFEGLHYYTNLFRLFEFSNDAFEQINQEYNYMIQRDFFQKEIHFGSFTFYLSRGMDGVRMGIRDNRIPPIINKTYNIIKPPKKRFKIKGDKIEPIFDLIGLDKPMVSMEVEEVNVKYENLPLVVFTEYTYDEIYHNPKSVATDMIYIPGALFRGPAMSVVEWEHKPAYTQSVININRLDRDLKENYKLLLTEFEKVWNDNSKFLEQHKDKLDFILKVY